MILALLLGAALGAQAETAAGPGPLGRFVICPGNVRCPPRPYGRPRRTEAAGPHHEGAPLIAGIIGNMLGRTTPEGQSAEVTFGPNQAGLTPEGRRALGPLAERLRANPRLEAVVEGHADSRGEESANVALAGRRAEVAGAYLAGQGVAADRILVLSWGEAEDAGTGAPRSVVVTLRRRAPPTVP